MCLTLTTSFPFSSPINSYSLLSVFINKTSIPVSRNEGKGQKEPLVVCKTVRNLFVSGLQQTFQWLVAVKVFNLVSMLEQDRKSTRLNSSHVSTSYAVFCL